MTAAPHPIPTAALDQPSCLVGTVGSGKTYAAKSAVELLLGEGRRVIVVDPTGVWHGLRTRADGAPGFPIVIFGGEQADVPVAPTGEAGAALGALLAEDRVTQAIVDVSEMTGGERTRFLTAMLERLYVGARVPRHLILDEADEMAPQNPLPEQMRLLGIVDKIVRRGRVRGFRPMMITQRPAVLSKNVLSQIATLVAMRLTSPQDRKAIEGWVKGSADLEEAKAVLASLPKLAVGEGWVWAPREGVLERTRFPAIATLDTSATPQTGDAPAGARAKAAVDVAALREAMVASVSPPINRLKNGSESEAASAAALAEAERRGEARGLERGCAAGWEAAVQLFGKQARAFPTAFKQHPEGEDLVARLVVAAHRAAGDQPDAAKATLKAYVMPMHYGTSYVPPPPREKSSPGVKKADGSAKPVGPHDSALNSAARKMLGVLDTNPPVRRAWQQVATLAGLKARGGHFNAGCKALRDAGLVVEADGLVMIAKPSLGAAPAEREPQALIETWCRVLKGAAPKILCALGAGLEDGRRETHSRTTIAADLGMKPLGGHWNDAWKQLRDNGLVEVTGDAARLSDVFVNP